MNEIFSPHPCKGFLQAKKDHKANDLIPEITFLYVKIITKDYTVKEGQETFAAITAALSSNYIKSSDKLIRKIPSPMLKNEQNA